MWKILYDHGAEMIVNGHDHHYERFAPQTPDGKPDKQRGIRQFIVGTGGSVLYAKGKIQPNSETFSNSTFGVLKLTLRPTAYRWEFIPTKINGYTDSGEGTCS
jgi:acid phosphatase type 7